VQTLQWIELLTTYAPSARPDLRRAVLRARPVVTVILLTMAKKEPPAPSAGFKNNPFASLTLDRGALPEGTEPEPAAPAPTPKRGRLVLRRETKHRGGKAVIIVRGVPAHELDTLAKQLKQKLGCGGTVERDGAEPEIVLQGDQPAKVAEWLRAEGFRVDGVTR
jgi:translation initiation factor 1